ncbi:methionine sulfoxide reductase B [Hanseniaspora valbyensis NRRL Y-1626]|uniref:peptide-methionine (R)-S-oxide reductase n=1 Tax=Hanseniaspora valbyensis NRRL Y-1626 TaxID=766949 RepID=A0A1B7TA83_9ASCO|nr:methionine sulfoxide reductase B [Hanseniaspora valbyensis NRRL Y-1626]
MSNQQATSVPAIQTKLTNPNLTYKEIRVMKDKGTEPPNSSEFLLNEKNGVKGKYFCKNCNSLLYDSTDMFESGCGWPSFHTSSSSIPSENADTTYTDNSMGMKRTEVCCLNCDSHLGHIFKGEGWERILGKGKGNRYCINGISLNFEKEK